MTIAGGLAKKLDKYRGHYGLIFFALLTVFALHPFVETHDWLGLILDLVYVITVLAILLAFRQRHVFFILMGLGLAVTFLTGADRATEIAYAAPLSTLARLAFFVVVISAILRDLFHHRRVTMNTVFGTCCVYLFMVLAWAASFSLVERGYPNSFTLNMPDAPTTAEQRAAETELVYFSLITITTVGYGDITPITHQARILAGLEGLIGQLFLAIVIARVVGMELAHRTRGRKEKDP